MNQWVLLYHIFFLSFLTIPLTKNTASSGNEGVWGLVSFSMEIHFRMEIAFHRRLLRRYMTRVSGHIFLVDDDLCYGCAACIALCPVDALHLEDDLAIVNEKSCTHCEHCIPSCPVFALSIVPEVVL